MGIDIFFSADSGSPFHQFIQSTAADETLELEWFTLAVGEQFIRGSQEDEYLAGRWYQIEAVLSQEATGRYQVHDPMVSPRYPQVTVLSPVSDV
jgi:hypothetical protein